MQSPNVMSLPPACALAGRLPRPPPPPFGASAAASAPDTPRPRLPRLPSRQKLGLPSSPRNGNRIRRFSDLRRSFGSSPFSSVSRPLQFTPPVPTAQGWSLPGPAARRTPRRTSRPPRSRAGTGSISSAGPPPPQARQFTAASRVDRAYPGRAQRVKDRWAGEHWCVGRLLKRASLAPANPRFHGTH
jgi:hypothetical protein